MVNYGTRDLDRVFATLSDPTRRAILAREFEFARVAEGTELTFTHAGLSTEVSQKSHTWGSTGALDKLVRRAGTAGAGAELDSEREST